jgi:hypothetical protein
METSTRLILVISALACHAILPQAAQAGGIELYEIATPDIGLVGGNRANLLLNPPQLDLGMTVPQSAMLGFYQDLTLNLTWKF